MIIIIDYISQSERPNENYSMMVVNITAPIFLLSALAFIT